jgi:hypothetical protein
VSDDPTTGLAVALRRLLDAAVLTEAGADELRAVSADVDALTARLAEASRTAMPLPDADGVRRGYRPYSPVVGTANPIAPPMTVTVLPDRSVVG